jgi:hypothetical protein
MPLAGISLRRTLRYSRLMNNGVPEALDAGKKQIFC